MKHKHYDLIVQWAADTSQKVWRKSPYDGGTEWSTTSTPRWVETSQYAICETYPHHLDAKEQWEKDKPQPVWVKAKHDLIWYRARTPNFDSATLTYHVGPTLPHPHQLLIDVWNNNRCQKVWMKDDTFGGWVHVGNPNWYPHNTYHVGEHPPAKTTTHEVVGGKQPDLSMDTIRAEFVDLDSLVIRRFVLDFTKLQDGIVRDALIARGWTPPTGDKA